MSIPVSILDGTSTQSIGQWRQKTLAQNSLPIWPHWHLYDTPPNNRIRILFEGDGVFTKIDHNLGQKQVSTCWKGSSMFSDLCQPLGQWLTRKTRRVQKSCYTHGLSWLQKRLQVTILKGKGAQGGVQERPGSSFQWPSSTGLKWIALNSPRNDGGQHLGSIASQGSSLIPWCFGFLLEFCHVEMECSWN